MVEEPKNGRLANPFGKATIFNQMHRHSRPVAPAGCTGWHLYLLTCCRETQMHAAMIDPPVTEHAAALVKRGMHQDVALPVAEGQNAAMGECILRLYRDAARPAMAELGRNLERAAARPGLSIIATEDHLVGADEQRRRASARAGAAIAELDGLGHWWFAQDPQRGAATINDFWAGVGRE